MDYEINLGLEVTDYNMVELAIGLQQHATTAIYDSISIIGIIVHPQPLYWTLSLNIKILLRFVNEFGYLFTELFFEGFKSFSQC